MAKHQIIIQLLEKKSLEFFADKTKDLFIEAINKDISNSNDAMTIVLNTKQRSVAFGNTVEKQLAISVHEL